MNTFMSQSYTKEKPGPILIIEDDKDIQEMVKAALEMEGYHVYTANNGKEGLEVLRNIPTPALILLDIMMPVMDGHQFIIAMKSDPALTAIPVAIVSAYWDRATTTPAIGIINKPIDLDNLLSKVTEWCKRPTS